MPSVRFMNAREFGPPHVITVRCADSWTTDIPGEYDHSTQSWVFELDDSAPGPTFFKFVADGTHWQAGPNLALFPETVDEADYSATEINFEGAPLRGAVSSTSNSRTNDNPLSSGSTPAGQESNTQPVANPGPKAAPEAGTSEPASPQEPIAGEQSLIGRFVTILTPVFALAAGWLAGVIAHALPGVQLNQGQIVAFMIAISTTVLAAAWKWLQGWQQHERLVAERKVTPRKARTPAPHGRSTAA